MAAEHHDLCHTQALESTGAAAESEQQPGMDVLIMLTLNDDTDNGHIK